MSTVDSALTAILNVKTNINFINKLNTTYHNRELPAA